MGLGAIGVIGAGVMGRGVSQALAQQGYPVLVLDLTQEVLDEAAVEIKRGARLYGLLGGNGEDRPKVSPKEVMSRIEFTTSYEPLAGVDYVVENVVESWGVKKEVYEALDRAAPPHAVFAANTSAIPITRIASATKRPGKVIGIHFMNPVPLKPTVEVIKGHHTSDETLDVTKELLTSIGKAFVIVNDAPGFVSNRVLMLMVNEAIELVRDRVASAPDVDRVFKECFGHKMGPLETGDLIGLDTILYSLEVLYDEFCDGRYRPSPLLRKMVDAGLLGRKSGQGFHSYDKSQPQREVQA